MQSPPIDPRDRDAIVAQTRELATRYSGWQPPGPGGSDPGSALIGVVGRFAEIVVERLNRAPQRGFLAFLNLIGIQPLPPQPARVPLSFALAEGSPGGRVPAGTAVAAPAVDDLAEAVFETETALVLTAAQLQHLFVGDPESDLYRARSGTGTGAGVPGAAGEAFDVFVGDRPVPRRLLVGLDPLLTAEGAAPVTLRLQSTEIARWQSGTVSWSAWTGAAWQPLPAPAVRTSATGSCDLVFAAVPVLVPLAVAGVEAGWLRAQLDAPLATPEVGPPEAVAVGRRAPQAATAGLTPFLSGSAPARWFYLSTDLPPGALARLVVALRTPGAAAAKPGLVLTWSLRIGNDWVPIGQSAPRPITAASTIATRDPEFADGTMAFTRDGVISFRPPPGWPATQFNGVRGRWLRVEADSDYTTQPVLESLTVDYAWSLPVISSISVVKQNGAAAWLPPPAGYAGAVELDLGSDVLPFGDQPGFNDACYLECPERVARSGPTFTLGITLSNSAGKTSGAPPVTQTPTLSWETFDGTRWRAATASRANAFTVDGDVALTPAVPPVASEIAGRAAIWVRARITNGDYGRAAYYQAAPVTVTATTAATSSTPATTTTTTTTGYTLVPSTLAPPVVSALTWKPAATLTVPASAALTENDFRTAVRWASPAQAGAATPFPAFVPGSERDPALYLGFDRPFEPSPVTLYLGVEPPAPDQVSADQRADQQADSALVRPAEVIWEYWGAPDDGPAGTGTAAGWQPLVAVDETGTLTDRGLLTFVGPNRMLARDCFGADGFWLRARWRSGEFPVRPRLNAVLPNTTWGTQASTVLDEILGSGTGRPGVAVTVAQPPVMPGPAIRVREPDPAEPDGVWLDWTVVPDLHASGPQDRHCTLDPLSGEIRFGDGRFGAAPAVGESNIRITYRTGGGPAGNRPAGAVSELKAALAYVDGVANPEPASGGAPQEPIERVGERGPRSLRHRDRAVTAQDLADLAEQASPEVARSKAVPPSQYDPYNLWIDPAKPVLLQAHSDAEQEAGRVGVIVVPRSAADRPTPGLSLLALVRDYLRSRAPATAGVWVAGPEWIRVTVTATLVGDPAALPDAVRAAVRAAIESYLHPLTGGPAGQGWAFGRKPHRSDLYGLVEAVPGVDHVRSLSVALVPESPALGDRLAEALARPLAVAAAQPAPADLQRWLDRALVYSGRHELTMTLRG